jgi:hypothetical protein
MVKDGRDNGFGAFRLGGGKSQVIHRFRKLTQVPVVNFDSNE